MAIYATRFSILKSKHKEKIVKAIYLHWFVLFGPPNQILPHNGGEFNNKLLPAQSNIF